MDSIEQTLCDVLAQTVTLEGPVDAETDLLDGLALASAQVMEFIMEVEDHFDIVIEQEALADVRTIGQLAKAVRRALS
ncbi:MAG: acyl carrier protein [Gammaproteobacteria bacterium]|nr:acyl carrier protein [Gammaproteobacteria bacterium]